MRAIPYIAEHFCWYGRGGGPILQSWILSDTQPLDNSIKGITYSFDVQDEERLAQVIFEGLQVIQIVPHEVHSYWHWEFETSERNHGMWLIEDSEWLKTFNPYHLANHNHYVLEFYDEIVEVICKDLKFDLVPE